MQIITCGLTLDVPAGEKPVTEAAFKRWLATQLKNCPLGTLHIGDPVEYSEQMVADALAKREEYAKRNSS